MSMAYVINLFYNVKLNSGSQPQSIAMKLFLNFFIALSVAFLMCTWGGTS